jgi:hypothetical protein
MSLVYAVKTIPIQTADKNFEDNFLNKPNIYSIVSRNELIHNNCSPILLGVEYGVNPLEENPNYPDPTDSLSFQCPFSILRSRRDIFKVINFDKDEILDFGKGLFTTLSEKYLLFKK